MPQPPPTIAAVLERDFAAPALAVWWLHLRRLASLHELAVGAKDAMVCAWLRTEAAADPLHASGGTWVQAVAEPEREFDMDDYATEGRGHFDLGQRLDLSWTAVRGTGCLVGFEALTALRLQGCALGAADRSPSALAGLVELDLSATTGPLELLQSCTSLRVLDLSERPDLVGLRRELGGLDQLETLHLGGDTGLLGVSALARLAHLRTLYLPALPWMRDDRMIDPIGHVPEVLCDSPWVQAAHRRARQRYLQRGGHEAALLADGVQLRAGNWLWPPELDADLSLAEWIRQLQARGALDPSTTTELDLSHHGLEHGEQLRPLSNLRRLTAVGASWQSLDGLGHCADLRVLLAGHDRTGWTLNILLDTSGSMTTELPLALGAIASFCRDANVDSVRLLQCDVEVTRDERMEPDQLQRVAIDGFSGSDMTPAMQRLASDIEVQAAVVLTDGCIEVPREAPPYAVLWVLTGDEPWNPGYGVTVRMP